MITELLITARMDDIERSFNSRARKIESRLDALEKVRMKRLVVFEDSEWDELVQRAANETAWSIEQAGRRNWRDNIEIIRQGIIDAATWASEQAKASETASLKASIEYMEERLSES